MKRRLLLVVVAALALLACGSSGDSEFTGYQLQEVLSAEWTSYRQDKPVAFGGGLAMEIISPKGAYFLATAMAPEVTDESHFRAASCTKTFTAAAIMLLQQRGKLNIDDPITAAIPGTATPYVPETANFNIPYKNQITIRMLLMHRAGVFDVANNQLPGTVPPPYGGKYYIEYVLEQDPNHQFTFDELIGVNAAYGLGKAPGAAYEYSNTGYSILGKIIERVSGKTYGAFVKDELMTPNQLWSSSLPSSGVDQTLPVPYAEGYIWDGTALANVTKSNMSANIAEGNVITTPAELSFWIYRLLRGEAGLNKAAVEMMKSGLPSTGDATYGLGISYSPKLGYGHTGAHEGYLTLMFYHPEKDVSFVIYANVWDLSDGKTSLAKQTDAMAAAAGKVLAKLGY